MNKYYSHPRVVQGRRTSSNQKAKVQTNVAVAKFDAYCFLFSDASRCAYKNHWDKHVWNNRLASV
ncbi:hypothetical protein N8338_01580 [Amylibacter sp.]|nr:hypothetical protein [Amylibacter sp.]